MLITDTQSLTNYTSNKRVWQGIPSLERTTKGRLFVAFYSGGVTEQNGNYCVLLKSDDGITFSEPIAVAYHGDQARCYDPCLWMDPLGQLWFIWAVAPDHGVWMSLCKAPDAAVLTWTMPRRIGQDVMMNKPIVTQDGAWLFPMAVWGEDNVMVHKTAHPEGAYVYESRDQGETFEPIGRVLMQDRGFDEHMFLEGKQGTLHMFVRTRYGIGQSNSVDGGHTWGPGYDSKLGGPNSRFHIRRLQNGHILLINHYQFNNRNNLAAMISCDEMQTWNGHLMIDERNDVSYPDATEASDGSIHIIYDRERGAIYDPEKSYADSAREILYARVTEADILCGQIVDENSFLKRCVSRLNVPGAVTE